MADATPDVAALERLRQAKSILALTGAGISAESGVPTFREAQSGLWARYDPMELATPEAFAGQPDTVWQWYQWRRRLVAEVEPNPAHYALANWEQHFDGDFLLVTQNVDGLHQRAGSQDVVELHGNLQRTVCSSDRHLFDPVPESLDAPPACPRCGSLGRPDVVWFGEMLPQAALNRATQAAASADVVLSIGTSSLVHPAASLPAIALEHGAWVIEINPTETPLTRLASSSLRGKAGEVLPGLFRRLFGSAQAH
ncbi:NAD-dependent deacetylase [Natronocella acetinitrilica]|uniref:NAD-dependent protein deacylase n=1 Tax=Natronocella acetinitrilica TaxID=414046 RepID=A0AAE3G8D5_9GAMM|nr:NAD-dependent deacylase [Natronocella acetinitrilica]MCP1676889.1 NAD-dependent deacetylase [Natronocella acetinitrilica]